MLQSAKMSDWQQQFLGLGCGWHIPKPSPEYFRTINEFKDDSYDLLWAHEEFQEDHIRKHDEELEPCSISVPFKFVVVQKFGEVVMD